MNRSFVPRHSPSSSFWSLTVSEKGLGGFSHAWWCDVMVGRHMGMMLHEESQGHSCNILSKDLRLGCLKDSVNTAHCSVDWGWFVNYNNRALPLCVYIPSGAHDGPSLFVLHTASDKIWVQGRPGNKAKWISALSDLTLSFFTHPAIILCCVVNSLNELTSCCWASCIPISKSCKHTYIFEQLPLIMELSLIS